MDRNSDDQLKIFLALLAVLVLAAAGLRFYGLGDKALWLDEVYTLVRTHQAGPGEVLERVKTNERHPPLFHLLSAPLLRPGHGDAAVRLLPALASTLTVLLTGLLGCRCFGRVAGLTAAGFAAVSSFEVTMAQEGRPAALAVMLLLASTLAFHHAVFGERRRQIISAVLYGLLVALALHTYYYAAYLVAAQLLFLLIRGVAGLRTSRDGKEFCWPVLLSGIIGGLLVLPWIFWARESLIRFGGMASAKEAVNYGPLALVDFFRALYVTPLKFSAGWLNWGLAVLVLLQLAAALLLGRRRSGQLLLVGLLLALPLAAVFVLPFKPELFQARHLACLSPFFLILLGRLASLLRPRWTALLLGAAFLVLNIFSLSLYYDSGYRKSAVRECSAAISASARPGDAILFSPPFASHSFQRYETGDPLPKIIVYPEKFDSLRGHLRRHRRVWLVEYHGATFGPLPSYGATIGRAMRPAGKPRTFAGVNEAISVSLHYPPGARRQRSSAARPSN